MDDVQGRTKSKDMDALEGINDANYVKSWNDSFDSIFNKELDLDIGNSILLFSRGSTNGLIWTPWKFIILYWKRGMGKGTCFTPKSTNNNRGL